MDEITLSYMQTFTIQIQKKTLPGIKFSIAYQHLNIRITKEQILPGPVPDGDPEMEITLQLLSGDISEIFHMAFFAALQKTTISLH